MSDVRTKIVVYCRTTFEGFHFWDAAPSEVAFLRSAHRHVFHVELAMCVEDENRQVEFILLKRKLDNLIELIQRREGVMTWSCERWAREILLQVARWGTPSYCDVSEDGENGARVTFER